MSIYLYNPLNVYCGSCQAKERNYCLELGNVKAGFHVGRCEEIRCVVEEGLYSERSSLSVLTHFLYQGEVDPDYRKCLDEAYSILSNLSMDKVEILMVLLEEGFNGNKQELFEVVRLL